ncbi:MAG: prepilin-type N-terminal cleavage/methylation domain-containing protein [Planctomyces sp.]
MKRDLKRQPAGISRTGFTLVEMLVSVALVLLMVLMLLYLIHWNLMKTEFLF